MLFRVTSHDIRGGETAIEAGSTRNAFYLPLLITIPSLLHARLRPPLVVGNSPDQAANSHVFRFQILYLRL